MIKTLMLLMALCVSSLTFANDLPGAPDNGEPDIRITYKDDSTYYEYRVNGQLKEIKVVPAVGKTYYLVPQKDGSMKQLDTSSLVLPKWVIFRW
jgi:hypothetical protein